MDRGAWRATVHGVTESDTTDLKAYRLKAIREPVFQESSSSFPFQPTLQSRALAWSSASGSLHKVRKRSLSLFCPVGQKKSVFCGCSEVDGDNEEEDDEDNEDRVEDGGGDTFGDGDNNDGGGGT